MKMISKWVQLYFFLFLLSLCLSTFNTAHADTVLSDINLSNTGASTPFSAEESPDVSPNTQIPHSNQDKFSTKESSDVSPNQIPNFGPDYQSQESHASKGQKWSALVLWRGIERLHQSETLQNFSGIDAFIDGLNSVSATNAEDVKANFKLHYSFQTESGVAYNIKLPYTVLAYNQDHLAPFTGVISVECDLSLDQADGHRDGFCSGTIEIKKTAAPKFYQFPKHALLLDGFSVKNKEGNAPLRDLAIRAELCPQDGVQYVCWSSGLASRNDPIPVHTVDIHYTAIGYDPNVFSITTYSWNDPKIYDDNFNTIDANCLPGYTCLHAQDNEHNSPEFWLGLDNSGAPNDPVDTGLNASLNDSLVAVGLRAWGFNYPADDCQDYFANEVDPENWYCDRLHPSSHFALREISGYVYDKGADGNGVHAVLRGTAYGSVADSQWAAPNVLSAQIIACKSQDDCQILKESSKSVQNASLASDETWLSYP